MRDSVPKTMLADLKDAIKNGKSVNIQDKYGATPVCNFIYPFAVYVSILLNYVSIYLFINPFYSSIHRSSL